MKYKILIKIISTVLLISFASSCSIPLREDYQDDLIFLISFRELTNTELIKKYKLEKSKSDSLDYFMFSISYKEDTRIDEAAGFLVEMLSKSYIRKFGHEQNYKNASIIDIFKTTIDSSYFTFDFFLVFSKLESIKFKEKFQKLDYKFTSTMNETVMESKYFETYNEEARLECIRMKQKEVETKLLAKFPEGIPDYISKTLHYQIYYEQLSCWSLTK